jgi:hypothetical protein
LYPASVPSTIERNGAKMSIWVASDPKTESNVKLRGFICFCKCRCIRLKHAAMHIQHILEFEMEKQLCEISHSLGYVECDCKQNQSDVHDIHVNAIAQTYALCMLRCGVLLLCLRRGVSTAEASDSILDATAGGFRVATFPLT